MSFKILHTRRTYWLPSTKMIGNTFTRAISITSYDLVSFRADKINSYVSSFMWECFSYTHENHPWHTLQSFSTKTCFQRERESQLKSGSVLNTRTSLSAQSRSKIRSILLRSLIKVNDDWLWSPIVTVRHPRIRKWNSIISASRWTWSRELIEVLVW